MSYGPTRQDAASLSPAGDLLRRPAPAMRWLTRLSCRLWGHHVDNRSFRRRHHHRYVCRCGQDYLRRDGSHTRVRHTLSCFLGHHTYARIAERDAHHEYVCVQCGHPLLFEASLDRYDATGVFGKKVRYLCGLFGHGVHRVGTRSGFTEYACRCGHSFLKSSERASVIRHPLVCVAAGHSIRYVESRAGYAEYVCRNCGHPFCFAEARGE